MCNTRCENQQYSVTTCSHSRDQKHLQHMASDTATEIYYSPAVQHATIASKITRDTIKQPTIKHKAISRVTSTDGYLQGCSTGHYHQGCSTGHHHQGCSSQTATGARTNSTHDKRQEIQTIISWYKTYRVTHTSANNGTSSTHAGTTRDIMISNQQRNGEYITCAYLRCHPQYAKNGTGPLPTKWADFVWE